MPRRNRARRRRVLIIVQNLPVPFDRRVWLECQALRTAGFGVSVICPKGPGDAKRQEIDGVRIYKYAPPPQADGPIGFAWEFLYCFAMTAWLTVTVWARDGIGVIQACNPPDTFFPLGLLARAFGRRFVFDQHDLCPELYESRFPDGSKLSGRLLLLLERATYATANHVIATNASYRAVALRRGAKAARDVTVVRTGPDPDKLTRVEADPALRRGRQHLVCYIGVMGPQDGVDIVLRAADRIVRHHGRTDVSFTLIGHGDCFDDLKALAAELDLGDYVHFTGRAPDHEVARIMSTADVGLSPDPKNPLNDVSTMNKTMEYMAFELPVVAFDLVETKESAREAAVYARPNDIAEYASEIIALLDDNDRRSRMGAFGRKRVEDTLAWHHQAEAYVGVYEKLMGDD